MANLTKTQARKRIAELREKLSDLRLEFEELQSDLEMEASDIEAYEGRNDLTELQQLKTQLIHFKKQKTT